MKPIMKPNKLILIFLLGCAFGALFTFAAYKHKRVANFILRNTVGHLSQLKNSSSQIVIAQGLIAGFESENDIKPWNGDGINLTLSKEHCSSGTGCLKAVFPKSDYPGLSLYVPKNMNWSGYNFITFYVFNPTADSIKAGVIIKDLTSSSYGDRTDHEFTIEPGENNLEIGLISLKTNSGKRAISLDSIRELVIFLNHPNQETKLYIDDLKLSGANTNESTTNQIAVTIDVQKATIQINPLIFGSNFAPKTTDDVKVERFVSDIGLTIFRFPGGDAPGYHWKTSTFDFGTQKPEMFFYSKYDHVVQFCKDTNTQLLMQLNLESGTPQEAAEWVDYTNKKLGFYVKYWELGNEAYGDFDKSYRPAIEYAKNLREYSEAMKAVDPNIKLGMDWGGHYFGDWDEIILKNAGDYVDFISYHWYPNHTGPKKKFGDKSHPDPLDVAANAFNVPKLVKRMNSLIKRYCPQRMGTIEYGILEWDGNWDAPSYDPEPYEQGIMAWSMANALFYAESLGQFVTNGITLATHYSIQEAPFGLIRGHITEEPAYNEMWDGVTIRPKALAIKMWRKYFGDELVESKIQNVPTYYKQQDWYDSSYTGKVPYISCYASKNTAGDKFYIMLISRHPDQEIPVKITVNNFRFKSAVTAHILTGPKITSQNDGKPGTVDIFHQAVEIKSPEFTFNCPKHSVVSLEFDRAD